MNKEQAKQLLRQKLIAEKPEMATVFAMQDLKESMENGDKSSLESLKIENMLEKLKTKGEDGYTPVKGTDYNDGYTPVKGVDYIDGKDGYTPIKGKDYFDGEKGEKGDRGIDGIDGKDGKEGKKGDKGEPGKDGIDADNISVIDIVKKMKELPLNERLDISDIRNWNQPAKGKLDQRWHGAGTSITLETNGTLNGSQKILNLIAGSNVTLTDNGVGGVTIASTGGAGGVTSITGTDSILLTPNPITSTGVIELVGDVTTPGNSKYYGTDSGGTRGWFALPASGSVAGSDTQVQYNNSGAFGASSHFEFIYSLNSLQGGIGSAVSAANSFAWGHNASADGVSSFATGDGTEAGGVASFASGINTNALGNYSFVTGSANTVATIAGAAFGSGNTLNNTASSGFIAGQGNTLSGAYAFLFGRNISSSTDESFTVGFGQADLIVTSGNVHVTGKLTVDGAIDPTYIEFTQITTPSNPASGKDRLYFKSDDNLYALTSTGTEYQVNSVSSVSNSDGTLTISPTTGAVVASLNLSNANTWLALQTFSTSTLSITGGTNGYVLSTDGSGNLSWVAQGAGGSQTLAQVLTTGRDADVTGTINDFSSNLVMDLNNRILYASDGTTAMLNWNTNTGLVTALPLTIGAYTLPNTDGTSGYVLTTDGAGNVTWQAGGGGGGFWSQTGNTIYPTTTTNRILLGGAVDDGGSILQANGNVLYTLNNASMRWEYSQFHAVSVAFSNTGISDGTISSTPRTYVSSTSGLYISTNFGASYSLTGGFNGQNLTSVGAFPGTPFDYVFVGTSTDLFFSNDQGATSSSSILSASIISIGTGFSNIGGGHYYVYAGTPANGIYAATINSPGVGSFVNSTTGNGLPSNNVLSIYGDTTAHGGLYYLYAGTDTGLGVSSDNGSTFTAYNTGSGMISNQVNAINKRPSGQQIWIATPAGVGYSTDFGATWTNFTTTNGLPSNNCTGVAFDNSNNIWVTTDSGLAFSNNDGVTWTTYTTSNGLASNNLKGVVFGESSVASAEIVVLDSSNASYHFVSSDVYTEYMKLTGNQVGQVIQLSASQTQDAFRIINNSGSVLFSLDSNGNISELNSVPYVFPGSQGGASTVLTNDGSGNLTWASSPLTLALQVNGTPNGSQTLLNLINGTGIGIVDGGTGGVTISITSVDWSLMTGTAPNVSTFPNDAGYATTSYVDAHLPLITSSGSQLAQTTDSTITTDGAVTAGTYEIGGYINVTAFTAGLVNLEVSYNDDTGAPQILFMSLTSIAGVLSPNVGGAGDFSALVTTIRTDGSANIVVTVNGTGFTGTYNAYAYTKRISN